MIREIAKSSHAFSEPIDLSDVLEKGLLTMKGRSYYVQNLNLLPEKIRVRIKQSTPTKYGIRVSFYLKGSKGLKKIANQLREYLD